MEHSPPKPIEQNFKNIRLDRQTNNNKIVYESLREDDIKRLNNNVNNEEYKRTLEDLDLTEAGFY